MSLKMTRLIDWGFKSLRLHQTLAIYVLTRIYFTSCLSATTRVVYSEEKHCDRCEQTSMWWTPHREAARKLFCLIPYVRCLRRIATAKSMVTVSVSWLTFLPVKEMMWDHAPPVTPFSMGWLSECLGDCLQNSIRWVKIPYHPPMTVWAW